MSIWVPTISRAPNKYRPGPTKDETVTTGRDAAAAKVKHIINNANGIIGEKRSYGNDPYPPQG